MKFSKDQNVFFFSVSSYDDWQEPRIGVFKRYLPDEMYCTVWFKDNNSSQPVPVFHIYPDTQKMREMIYQIRLQHEAVRKEDKQLLTMIFQARNAVTRGEV